MLRKAPAEDRAAQRRRRASVVVIALIVLTILMQIGGFLYTWQQQQTLNAMRAATREMRTAQQALADAESGVSNYLLSGNPIYLREFYADVEMLDAKRASLEALDASAIGGRAPRLPAPVAVDRLTAAWNGAIEARRAGAAAGAALTLLSAQDRRILADLRTALATYVEVRTEEGTRHEGEIALAERVLLVLQIVGGVMTLVGLIFAFRLGAIEARGRHVAVLSATRARSEVEQLFQMADTLQSASGYADANAVLRATAETLIPGYGGALYIFNNSRDRLDLSTSWGEPDGETLPALIGPHQCWALKRGKHHVNSYGAGALRCEHFLGTTPTLEIPMMARGEVHGLLQIHPLASDTPEAALQEVEAIASAIADGMSLALSNIALREKLRNQALRDPLTGLYNRRYMEDMLERLTLIAERNRSSVAAIMIDLDHFKRLNDEHGHAKGDAVLRDAAAALVSGLRQSDVACRYGGEELLVLLPDCPLGDAVGKAEMIRARIEALSEQHGARVTASFGVAAIPETGSQSADLLTQADAALYRAKHEGRNRVEAAPLRTEAKPLLQAAE